MTDGRGKWLRYSGTGIIPCEQQSYVDVCEGEDNVFIYIPAHQAFDRSVTHWRPSIDDATRKSIEANNDGR